jgi:hypothetical protein
MAEVMVRDTVHLDDAIRKVQWDTVVVVWGRDMEDDSLTILRHTLDQVIMEVTIMVEGGFDLDWAVFDSKCFVTAGVYVDIIRHRGSYIGNASLVFS